MEAARRAVEGLQRQRCKVCWIADGFDFHVPDDIWAAVVPAEFLGRVVCLTCFDRFAREAGVPYARSLESLYFAGEGATFEFTARVIADVEPDGAGF